MHNFINKCQKSRNNILTACFFDLIGDSTLYNTLLSLVEILIILKQWHTLKS